MKVTNDLPSHKTDGTHIQPVENGGVIQMLLSKNSIQLTWSDICDSLVVQFLSLVQ